MQIVNIKELKELAKKTSSQLKEADRRLNEHDLFDDFKKTYDAVLKQFEAKIQPIDKALRMTYALLRDEWLLLHCPPIKYIALGSSRAAYAFYGGRCLKVAVNLKGLALNEVEWKNATFNEETGTEKLICFADNYDVDASTYGSLLTECCARFDDGISDGLYFSNSAYAKILKGAGFHAFDILTNDLLNGLNAGNFDISQSIAALEADAKSADDEGNNDEYFKDKFCAEFLKKLKLNASVPKFKVFADLISFYVENGKNDDAMTFGDLLVRENWGMAIRDMQIVPVIVDPGLSGNVWSKFYSQVKHTVSSRSPKAI